MSFLPFTNKSLQCANTPPLLFRGLILLYRFAELDLILGGEGGKALLMTDIIFCYIIVNFSYVENK
ncbi:hypothetical protein DN757_20055 [Paenibacillus silvae]|uniref:Uncharacterized protein n=1 Tax=Paenibacillus silvae TaxID=1325358 RepID=A0A2W6NDQ3_9BACL|nr:hypothetical protein DN757_20055 [Paenibacillus silvae]